jgi:hypothetical protein
LYRRCRQCRGLPNGDCLPLLQRRVQPLLLLLLLQQLAGVVMRALRVLVRVTQPCYWTSIELLQRCQSLQISIQAMRRLLRRRQLCPAQWDPVSTPPLQQQLVMWWCQPQWVCTQRWKLLQVRQLRRGSTRARLLLRHQCRAHRTSTQHRLQLLPRAAPRLPATPQLPHQLQQPLWHHRHRASTQVRLHSSL